MRIYKHGDKEYVVKHASDHNGLVRLYLKEDESVTIAVHKDRLEESDFILIENKKKEL